LVAEIAVTVIELDPDGVPVCTWLVVTLPPPPPQLTVRRREAKAVHKNRARLVVLRLRKVAKKSRLKKPATATGQTRKRGGRPASGAAVDCAVVVSVRVVETGFVPGVTLAGEKLHAAPAGNPLHEKPTVEVRSPAGVIVMVKVADWPARTVAFCGLASMVKSAGTETRISSTSVVDVA